MKLLSDQVVAVTGAGQGNGEAIAKGLAEHGASIAVIDIDAQAAARVAAQIVANGHLAAAFTADVSDYGNCAAVAQRIAQNLGAVSVLVNNAGVCPRVTFEHASAAEEWDRTMAVNLDGAVNMVRVLLPDLRATRGRIVNITSIAAYVTTKTSVGYAASKAALTMFTKALAQELGPVGVRVNAVAPGPFATPLTAASRSEPERLARFLERIPLGRYGEPREMVGPVLFLASDLSSFVTGSILVVDGGFLTN